MNENIRVAKQQKERELMALQQVSYSVEQLKEKLENMVSKFEDIQEGTKSVELVLSNWNDVKRIISMATLSLAKYSDQDYENDAKIPLTEGAVRVLIDESDKDKEKEESTGETPS